MHLPLWPPSTSVPCDEKSCLENKILRVCDTEREPEFTEEDLGT
jgi:hypothetical protein